VCAIACGACGGKVAERPLISHTAPVTADAAPDDTDHEADAWVDECESQNATIARGEVVLEICHTGDSSSSERAAADGFITHSMRGTLRLTPAVGSPVELELGTWDNGWEWSTTWKLEGTLASAHGDEVVLVSTSSYAAGPGIDSNNETLRVYQLEHGKWNDIQDIVRATLEVSLSADHRVATVTGCLTMQSANPAGCHGFADGDPAPTTELRWDGTTISETTLPSP
jgi:hypothetical protein